MKIIFIPLFSLIASASILKSPSGNQEGGILEIRFGTSFGMCSGYCIQEASFSTNKVEKTLIPHRDKSLEVKKCTEEFSGFEQLISKVDLKAFDQLEVTIGCPDCADGGAEWVQIFTSEGYDKKITYSYGKEPDALKPYIGILREYYDKLEECK